MRFGKAILAGAALLGLLAGSGAAAHAQAATPELGGAAPAKLSAKNVVGGLSCDGTVYKVKMKGKTRKFTCGFENRNDATGKAQQVLYIDSKKVLSKAVAFDPETGLDFYWYNIHLLKVTAKETLVDLQYTNNSGNTSKGVYRFNGKTLVKVGNPKLTPTPGDSDQGPTYQWDKAGSGKLVASYGKNGKRYQVTFTYAKNKLKKGKPKKLAS
ncbi:MAG: hypothetical protein LBR32_01540 [Propionibacteriaceae bacterium]|jgi:hypothetical protein|nr:hypothetical protein [Propionibacteriaceae bacterium]